MDTDSVWSDVDGYFTDRLHVRDPDLERVLRSAEARGMPNIHVSPSHGKLLGLLVRMTGARRVLEVGTLAGYSAICMARALPADGRVVTLELNPLHASVSRENIRAAGLEGKIEVVEGPAATTLEVLHARGGEAFDVTFIDADKPSNPVYFAWALRLTRPGGVIIVDNVVRGGKVADGESTDAGVRGVRELVELIAGEPRVSATAVQTVGVKGYDGFLVAVVNG